ncbi:MAG: hypothetical protein ACI81P_000652 [Neolewinella sp.]
MDKTATTIAKSSLHIEAFREHFREATKFSVSDITQFYQKFEEIVKRSTVDWRIYKLKSEGIIHRLSRGNYSLSEVRHYVPSVTRENKLLYTRFKAQFPFAEGCYWDTKWINEFMLHQPAWFFSILEVEREVMESVFYEMKELGQETYLNPSDEIIDKYITSERFTLIILPLVSEAPTQEIDGVRTITVEKMLVDLVSNESLFAAQQGSELKRIFKSAHEKYAVSEAKLLRYASRRNRRNEVKTLLQEVQRNGNEC